MPWDTSTLSPSNLLGFIDFLGECAIIDDAPQLNEALDRVAQYFDVQHVALCLINYVGERPVVIDHLNHSFPEPWLVHYASSCCRYDPVLRHTAELSVPVYWSDVEDCCDNSELCDSARDFGLLEGVSYAFGNGIKSLIALSSSKRQFRATAFNSDRMLRAMTPLLHDALQRVFYRKQCSFGELRLTAREREILYWSAEGKSLEQISIIFGVSIDTVKFHIKNLYSKLNVENRYHAISKALRAGLI